MGETEGWGLYKQVSSLGGYIYEGNKSFLCATKHNISLSYILFYICYIIPDLKSNLGPGGPPASLTLWHGERGSAKSAVGEREKQDTSGTSRSSANDKHLCLISVIDIEGPDKSHQVTGSKGRERLTGSSSHLERLCQIKNCMLPEILSYFLGEWKRSEHHSFLFVLRALNKIWLCSSQSRGPCLLPPLNHITIILIWLDSLN